MKNFKEHLEYKDGVGILKYKSISGKDGDIHIIMKQKD